MALVTEARLRSRKSPGHELEKSRNSMKKRRRHGNVAEAEKEEDSCAVLYRAAQDQLNEEMKAAGMEGIFPLSFGSGSRPQKSKKRKGMRQRSTQRHDEKVRVDDGMKDHVSEKELLAYKEDQEANAFDELNKQVLKREALITMTTVVDKVRVVYNSDGEVAERVIQQVEGITDVKSQEQSILSNIEHDKSTLKARKIKYPVSKDVVKFYVQRHILFEKFEEGIQLDHESWYSVTPQIIAEHIAKRLACDVVVDPFSGCGGNVIQLAMTCKLVIAIDIDPEKIRMAKHNATIYGVADKIEFIVGNAIDLLPKLKADVVFLSPPWGGVKYSRKHFKLEDMHVKGVSGIDLFEKARHVSKNIAYYLPRGTPTKDLEMLAPGECVECEIIFLNKQLKVVTAYYGDLAGSGSHVNDTALQIEEAPDDQD